MQVRHKLLWAYALKTVIMLVIGVFIVSRIISIQKHVDVVLLQSSDKLEASSKVSQQLQCFQADLRSLYYEASTKSNKDFIEIYSERKNCIDECIHDIEEDLEKWHAIVGQETSVVLNGKYSHASYQYISQQISTYLTDASTLIESLEDTLAEKDSIALYTAFDSVNSSLLVLIRSIEEYKGKDLLAETNLIRKEMESVIGSILAGITIVMFMHFFWVYLLSRINLIPIKNLKEVAEKISTGNTKVRCVIEADDEIGQLAQSFNSMLDSLEEATLSRAYANRIFDSMRECLIVIDNDHIIKSVNQSTVTLLEYTEEELLGNSFCPIVQKADANTATTNLVHCYIESSVNIERSFYTKSGLEIPVLFSSSTLIGDDGEVQGLICTAMDIREQKKSEDTIKKLSFFDPLTNLPNREHFAYRVSQNILSARRSSNLLGVLFIDLDQFRFINDSYGHTSGDSLLKIIAGKFKKVLRGNSTLARLGGDEFALVVEDLYDRMGAAYIARRLIEEIENRIEVDDNEFFVTSSIGIAIYPNDGKDYQTLLKNADTAMNKVKESGRNGFRFFASDMNAELEKRVDIERKLHRALENDEFTLFYQPKVDVETKRVVGMEALIRWFTDENTMISPADFIPVAEKTNLICKIDEWVLLHACKQLKKWQERGWEDLKLSVNLSGFRFKKERIINLVSTVLNQTGINPLGIELEITEGTLMADIDEAIDILSDIRAMGITISIDDFGTGYSSLNYLKKFPVNKIKIDQSFVRGVTTTTEDAAITRSIIAMAKNLNLELIAEGVETNAQLDFLYNEGCSEIQGYFFSKPLPLKEFNAFVDGFSYNQFFKAAQK